MRRMRNSHSGSLVAGKVMVAASGFGAGIDYACVRLVVHVSLTTDHAEALSLLHLTKYLCAVRPLALVTRSSIATEQFHDIGSVPD
jgi:hypothetical protein